MQAFNMPHTGPQRHSKVQNIAYRVEVGGKSILHIGDADTAAEGFEKMGFLKTDIVIVPYWFLTNSQGKEIIEKFNPEKIIATHIAPGEKPSINQRFTAAEVIIFDAIGQTTGL